MYTSARRTLLAAAVLIAGCTERMQPTGPAAASPEFGAIASALACGGVHAPAIAFAGAEFGPPLNLGPVINSPGFDGGPSVAPSELVLFLASDRPGGQGNSDIWMATRTGKTHAFESPVNLGPLVNSAANESAPEISADGLSLYFDSDRAGGFGQYDIWVAKRRTPQDPFGPLTRRNGSPSAFGPPENLGPVLTTLLFDVTPEISTNGMTLYFMSNRPGGVGWLDLWQTTRTRPSTSCEHNEVSLRLGQMMRQ